MRSRKHAPDQVAEVARRRLELLSAELAGLRPGPDVTPVVVGPDETGEPSDHLGPPRPAAAPGAGRHAHRPVGAGSAWSGWVQDRLPGPLQGRVRVGVGHLALLALLVAAALAAGAWWALQAAGPSETTVPTSAPLASPSALATPTAAAGAPLSPAAGASAGASTGAAPAATVPSAAGTIVVDVAGKVRRPGIATLPLGSRVVDALEAAGGARAGVRLGTLNLARVLVDGEQVVVGVPAPGGVAASAASAPTAAAGGIPMVNINTGTQADLEELPGVGPVTAQAILDFRSENGSFSAVDELLEVSGIGDATLAKIAPYVTL